MDTLVLTSFSDAPQPDAIARAAAVLRDGGLVAFPTETVYGLGANALDAGAVARIFETKGRPARNPLIVHVSETAAALQVVEEWPEVAARLAARFWPGPLTLVLPRSAVVPDIVTGGGPTVAVRVPAHPVALALLHAAGIPVAAPSANRSTRLSPTRAIHVLRELGGRIELILDGGATTRGIESTVLDVTTTPPRLLRPGPIDRSALENLVGKVAHGPLSVQSSTEPLPAPGMLSRHYAPRTPLVCMECKAWETVNRLIGSHRRVAWVTFFVPAAEQACEGVIVVVLPSDPVGYAAQLYDTLHRMDEMNLDCILVSLPPDTGAWLAVRDRLLRAASAPC